MKEYSDYESITENESFVVPLDMFKADVKKYLGLRGKELDKYVNCLCVIWLSLTTLKDAFGFSKGFIGIPEDTIFDIVERVYGNSAEFFVIFNMLKHRRYKIKWGVINLERDIVGALFFQIPHPKEKDKFTEIKEEDERYEDIASGYADVYDSLMYYEVFNGRN